MVVQLSQVGMSQFAGNIQPQPGAAFFGSEKRFEQLVADFGSHTRAIIRYHDRNIQFATRLN